MKAGRHRETPSTESVEKTSALGSHNNRCNPSRRKSDSASQQFTKFQMSQSQDNFHDMSRFPYHGDHRSIVAQRRRTRSADYVSTEFDVESSQLESPASVSSSTSRLTPVVATTRTNFRGLDHSGSSLGEGVEGLDQSAKSGLLMLQESGTFDLFNGEVQSGCWNFAMEHRIFLKAALELLAERDNLATEVGMNDPNVLKSGPLKKASHLMRGIWKVKYVEIRRGMFSYYEDAVPFSRQHGASVVGGGGGSAESLLRKNIPLEANSCQCRPVRLHQKAWNITPRGAIFELAITGRPKRLWMANSREERQAFIQAIHDAMVGGSVTRGGNAASQKKSGAADSRSPHKDDLKKYMKVQHLIKHAKTKEDYVVAIRSLYHLELNVPVKWIIKQSEQENKEKGSAAGDVKGAFHEEDVKFSVGQLFKDLLRDTVTINGEIYHGNSGHAPERIVGALAREIMVFGRRNLKIDNNEESSEETIPPQRASTYDMNECQALSYARDVLLSGNRTRSGGDSYFCVSTLCKNSELVVVVPSSAEAEPLILTVEQDDDDDSAAFHQDMYSKSGWLRTRRRTKNAWVKAYFVLSEKTLSFYEKAQPRPHGLKGQLTISDANISVAREDPKGNGTTFVLTIVTKDKSERQILFETQERLLVWTYALECTAKAKGGATPAPLMKAMKSVIGRLPKVPVPVPGSVLRTSMTSPVLVDSSKLEGSSLAEAALKEHVANLGLDFDALEERLAAYANQTSSTVKVSVEARTVYKICTLDPQGDPNEDDWAIIDATFLQDFRVSGGPNGRIIRGEEIVRVEATKCAPVSISRLRSSSQKDQNNSGSPNSPGRMQKLLRTFSDDVDKKDKPSIRRASTGQHSTGQQRRDQN